MVEQAMDPGAEVEAARRRSLSPSRAGDFKACPLLYRYRMIDRLPERPSVDAARGSVVHRVLEELFDLPAGERTPERAATMVPGAWEFLQEADPRQAGLFDDDPDAFEPWLESCRRVLARYFELEDPTRLEPAEREVQIEVELESGLLLRGIVDRVDVAPDGAVRVVDYKSSRSPSERYEANALFQLRFYALILWRTRGAVPAMLRLLYLGNSETLTYVPDEDDLLAVERNLHALDAAIALAIETGDFQPQRGAMCGWCSYQEYCPEFGGTPPPLPEGVVVLPLADRPY